ncbi:MAG: NTP transferase domain-containing protein [archaeon]
MDYKVCILAAGVGSRMQHFSQHLNKVLLPVRGKPTICHIIEKFPENIEIVIAVGHKKESLITFLKTAYPNRKLTFVEVSPYVGEGSGAGYSLLSCKNHLMCPFVHIAGDTLVKETITCPDSNWLGISKAQIKDSERFCSVKLNEDTVIRIDDKIKTDNKYAYIGVLGVKDYEPFWDALEKNNRIIDGEIQISNGMQPLLEKGLKVKNFTWFDTGTPKAYEYSIKNYPFGDGYTGD